MRGVIAGPLVVLAACAATPEGDAPDLRARENVADAATSDSDRLYRLVERLDADDVVVRMTALRALESRTGETLGFDPHAPRSERIAGQARWIEWIRGRDSFSPSPSASKIEDEAWCIPVANPIFS